LLNSKKNYLWGIHLAFCMSQMPSLPKQRVQSPDWQSQKGFGAEGGGGSRIWSLGPLAVAVPMCSHCLTGEGEF